MHRADQGKLVGTLAKLGQLITQVHAGHFRASRAVLAAHFDRHFGLHVVHIQLARAALAYVDNVEGMIDGPRNGTQRTYIRETVEMAKAMLHEQGHPITTAALQALIWYPEKSLFYKMGVKPGKGESIDYEEGVRQALEKMGP